ncbi:unnamed protein product [Dovyalis caffra]|uniref:Uncharacterized protein n=1 Tax=Dovyalis caffra TaxID=77055 RepID=A0AAV1RGM8_9ROSI|nr:unnamed protein product [Dovyalis caffra]
MLDVVNSVKFCFSHVRHASVMSLAFSYFSCSYIGISERVRGGLENIRVVGGHWVGECGDHSNTADFVISLSSIKSPLTIPHFHSFHYFSLLLRYEISGFLSFGIGAVPILEIAYDQNQNGATNGKNRSEILKLPGLEKQIDDMRTELNGSIVALFQKLDDTMRLRGKEVGVEGSTRENQALPSLQSRRRNPLNPKLRSYWRKWWRENDNLEKLDLATFGGEDPDS